MAETLDEALSEVEAGKSVKDISLKRHALIDAGIASQSPTKQKRNRTSSFVEVICSSAFEHGLSQTVLGRLIDLVTLPNSLDQTSIGQLIQNLYPADKVTDDVVVRVVGCLGQGQSRPSLSSQLELSRTIGHEPALVGLIRTYKDYYPDIVVGEAAAGRATLFKDPDPEWSERLVKIQEAHAQRRTVGQNGQHSFKVVRRGAKRGKISSIPEVHTSRAHEGSITLEDVDSVDDFVQKLDRLEPPDQIVSALNDQLMRTYLLLRPSSAASRRLENWLALQLDEELESLRDKGVITGSRLKDMLESILNYAHSTKVLPSASQQFLKSLMLFWDGKSEQTLILNLLSYLPITLFETLKQEYLSRLERILLSCQPNAQTKLLTYYNDLCRQWTVLLLSSNRPPSALKSLTDLAAHATTLSLSILAQPSPSISATAAILTFQETLTHSLPVLSVPPPSSLLTSHLTFTPSLSTLSRLCSLITTLKLAYTSPATSAPPPPAPSRQTLNTLLIDTCNLFWRNRALGTTDAAAQGCLAPPTLLPALRTHVAARGLSLPSLFSLSHAVPLAALSIACFREMEDDVEAEDGNGKVRLGARHAGPVTQRSLQQLAADGGLELDWTEYRVRVLAYLDQRGVTGISRLMGSTMRGLMASNAG
ncbi:MAG: hypothetical protein M1825_003085 [Sarcosagium campestre]|nr:MAG: hypothetical protein M1825_003085 [Sarcosagium campestre]